MNRPTLILHRGKDKSILRRHPWLFSGAVAHTKGHPVAGDLVDILSADGNWLAVGHYQNDSIICKILSFDSPVVDDAFWDSRIELAVNYRRRLGLLTNPDTTMFRLVHGEGDQLPGLIADYYNGILVLQAHSMGMHRMFPLFVEFFRRHLPSLIAVYDKSSATLPNATLPNAYLWGGEQPDEWEVAESGLRYMINFDEGQKTGFFLDQRDNRELVGRMASGQRVLNCFSYTGGFSLAALHGGATLVHSVDISRRAIDLCNRHVNLNFDHAPHEAIVADVTQYLDTVDASYNLIILDPPAFAKNHRSLQNGLKGYRHINQRAIEKIAPSGWLFTFSCSQAVSAADFQTMVFTSAANAHRNVRIVRRLHHGADHPVSVYHPEGEYLKGLLLYVE